MVCLGVFFGCKHHRSFKDYVVSALVILCILLGLKLILFAVYWCLKRASGSRHGRTSYSSDAGTMMEMQPPAA
ncbi:hypothetical protein NL676_006773 [Syzygium grande]|nr:hypothetical protein NL676_006773 [Syzygium grande]